MTNPLDINFPNVGLNAYLPPLDAARSRTFTLDTGRKSTLIRSIRGVYFVSRKVETDSGGLTPSDDEVKIK